MKKEIKKIFDAEFRVDGEFVHYDSMIGYDMVDEFDPFLLMDVFGRNRQPQERVLSVPFRPHRGMEVITYLIEGHSEHKDQKGNLLKLNKGDVSLMHSGCGVLHSERSVQDKGDLYAVQLWVNLAKKDKKSKPYYAIQHKDDIHIIKSNQMEVYVLIGDYQGAKGLSTKGTELQFYHINIQKSACFETVTKTENTAWVYVLEGSLTIGSRIVEKRQVALFQEGEEVCVKANEQAQFLYIEGKPHHEPIAWGGTFVMNSPEELEEACKDLECCTFDKEDPEVKEM